MARSLVPLFLRLVLAAGLLAAVGDRFGLISAPGADPLNVVEIVLPGARISVIPTNRILYRDGVPIAITIHISGRHVVWRDERRSNQVRRPTKT